MPGTSVRAGAMRVAVTSLKSMRGARTTLAICNVTDSL